MEDEKRKQEAKQARKRELEVIRAALRGCGSRQRVIILWLTQCHNSIYDTHHRLVLSHNSSKPLMALCARRSSGPCASGQDFLARTRT